MADNKTIRQKLQDLNRSSPKAATNVLTSLEGNRFYIFFNRPERYNAFTPDMYDSVMNYILFANENQQVKFIILSGKGGNFSSGNDLNNFVNPLYTEIGDVSQRARATAEGLQDFCNAIINSAKPIFAIVEGKVIGFAFTQLALYDRVYAVEGAQFNAPLVQIAQGPEMCASYTFPKIFGKNVGEDLIMKGKKVDSKFLQQFRFAQRVLTREQALKSLQKHLVQLDELEWESYLNARKLFRDNDRKQLIDVNKRQCKNLVERWTNPELPNHLVEYMRRIKSKAKL